jgi:hypothetical protein
MAKVEEISAAVLQCRSAAVKAKKTQSVKVEVEGVGGWRAEAKGQRVPHLMRPKVGGWRLEVKALSIPCFSRLRLRRKGVGSKQ